MKKNSRGNGERTIGLDLGDKRSHWCVVDEAGEVERRDVVTTSRESMQRCFGRMEPCRIVIENGSHARWVCSVVKEMGHEVIVANRRKSSGFIKGQKTDRSDAETLARVGRMDPKLLAPIQYRGEQAQADRAVLKARDAVVRARTQLINQVRGVVKAHGGRVPACSAPAFAKKASLLIPTVLQAALDPLVRGIEQLNTLIKGYDKQIEGLCRKYPQTERLRQVTGVGPMIAVAFVVTVEDPARFAKSRQVGPFLGLTPGQHQSSDSDPQLRISKAGDGYLRRLLVNGAQYILGRFGPDCDLRRHGLKIAERGGKNAKKRAVIAVARKLAVLLHRLWVSSEPYDPLYNSKRADRAATVACRPGVAQVPAGLLHSVTPLRVTAPTPARLGRK